MSRVGKTIDRHAMNMRVSLTAQKERNCYIYVDNVDWHVFQLVSIRSLIFVHYLSGYFRF